MFEVRGEAAGGGVRSIKATEITTVCEISNAGINSNINLLSIAVCFTFSSLPPHVSSPLHSGRFHSSKQSSSS